MEDFKKFRQKLEKAISQQESAAQAMNDRKSTFDDIDKEKLHEEVIRKLLDVSMSV